MGGAGDALVTRRVTRGRQAIRASKYLRRVSPGQAHLEEEASALYPCCIVAAAEARSQREDVAADARRACRGWASVYMGRSVPAVKDTPETRVCRALAEGHRDGAQSR
ncbi:hypothetical protein AcV7_009779 [Taiwanofungus camphoratus]|nr:hypothetical protein AcV7_009779 [Antrodia cinnamomea]